jgi:hypothetical protein
MLSSTQKKTLPTRRVQCVCTHYESAALPSGPDIGPAHSVDDESSVALTTATAMPRALMNDETAQIQAFA